MWYHNKQENTHINFKDTNITLHVLDRKTVWSMSPYITISEKKVKSTFPIDFTVWVYLSTLTPCRQMVCFYTSENDRKPKEL